MSFGAPQWLLLLPFVLFLLWLLNYLARRRRRVVVPSLLIWRRLLARRSIPRSSSRKFFTLSLLFQWLAACALLSGVASPQTRILKPRPIRVLLLRSAATLAKTENRTTVFDHLLQTIHRIAPNAKITTIPPGPLRPCHLPSPAPPPAGFDIFATDRPRRTAIKQLVLPAARPNAAITALKARQTEQGSLEVLVRLLSTGMLEGRLIIRGTKRPVERPLKLECGERSLILRIEPASDLVEFQLQVKDALQLDNRAYLSRATALEEVALEAGLDEAVLRGLAALGLRTIITKNPQKHLFCVLKHLPSTLPQKGVFLLFLKKGGLNGVFRVVECKPRGVVARKEGFMFPDALEGLKSRRYIEGRADEVWAETDDGDAVIAVFRRGERTFVVCALDVRESGWFRRASFVEFLWRFCALCGGAGWKAVAVGQTLSVPSRVAVAPSGRRIVMAERGGGLFVPDEVGVWSVDGRRIGVSLLNRRESEIDPHWRTQIPQVKGRLTEEVREFWWLLVVAGMVFLVVALWLERRE